MKTIEILRGLEGAIEADFDIENEQTIRHHLSYDDVRPVKWSLAHPGEPNPDLQGVRDKLDLITRDDTYLIYAFELVDSLLEWIRGDQEMARYYAIEAAAQRAEITGGNYCAARKEMYAASV